MKQVTIKAGDLESESCTLAHWKLGTVFVPPVSGDQFRVEIFGSHDKKEFGPIDDGLAFYTQERYSVHSFDPQVFAGIQFIKFFLNQPAPIDLEFHVHLIDS